ncbi:protein LTO1 homolog [Drosophila nasuta]|uniref:protein LTO1 homolog n=1 Tax=Drosophila nasuta TaxID=42062 RepID=UPI00295EAF23|nr:protein LTO1 homolog [Drosophila nasuta]
MNGVRYRKSDFDYLYSKKRSGHTINTCGGVRYTLKLWSHCRHIATISMASDDINDLFDDILLTEETHARLGYEEGIRDGSTQGNQEGYQLGYAQGVQLGEELGGIYGQVVAQHQLEHTEKVQRTLQQLRTLIDQFPRNNDPEADIIGSVELIRNTHRRLTALLGTKKGRSTQELPTGAERKDLSF